MATALVLLSKPVAGASTCKFGVIKPPRRMAASGARSSILILLDRGCMVWAVIGKLLISFCGSHRTAMIRTILLSIAFVFALAPPAGGPAAKPSFHVLAFYTDHGEPD